MSTQEQQQLKKKYYGEAIRYMDNARDCLKKAKKEDGFYNDQKYVRMACGTAYNGLLVALDGFFVLKGIHRPDSKKRKSIEYYQKNITGIDQKMLNGLNSAYKILHLWGYYDGIEKVTVVNDGFEEAYKIIEKIKPEEDEQ
jgi:hypothetical protein